MPTQQAVYHDRLGSLEGRFGEFNAAWDSPVALLHRLTELLTDPVAVAKLADELCVDE